ncbi:MAG TPA: DUF177 domain-containing protein [Polyangiales bacterium]
MAALAIQIHDIDETGKDYTFPLSSAWLQSELADAGLRPDPAAPAAVAEVHAQKNGDDYLVNGRVDAGLLAECGRCLGDAKVPVHVGFASLFCRHSDRQKPTEQELEDEDFQREEYSGHQLVLDGLVREQLVLECPMQPLCRPDCTGIPVPEHVRPPVEVFGTSEKGADRVDPRLAPLQRLRDKVPPNKKE